MTTATEKPRVLCVDDEPAVLQGLLLHLRRRFDVATAESGPAGLSAIEAHGPFAVVVSDMRMPGMSGAEFLARARSLAPDTTRILLTGHADFTSAVSAVNDGQIFRFLQKPCPAPAVLQAIEAGAELHRLVCAERVLLEQTLAGSIQMLVDVLSLASPIAFGRAGRLKRHAAALCDRLAVRDRWHIEAAAQLSQIGCIALPPAVAEKVYYGHALAPAEKEMVARMPATADRLLANIARFEPVREILALKDLRHDGKGSPPDAPRGKDLPLGARVLKLVLAYDALETAGTPVDRILGALCADEGEHDPALLAALREASGQDGPAADVRDLPVSGLRPGMVFLEDLRSKTGMLLVARGLAVTEGLVERLRNLPPGTVKEPLRLVVNLAAGAERARG